MARRSRKQLKGSPEPKPKRTTERVWRCAIYCRLSVLDNGGQPGASIAAQEEIVRDALEPMTDIQVVGVYKDNGYTGTNFDRPAFEEVLAAIHDGLIDAVAVKDLSRFGRNHLEAGYYIERILPAAGVRFISIADHIDTLRAPGTDGMLTIELKNLVNEVYARDISVKGQAARLARVRAGTAKIGRAPYGYRAIEPDKTRLEIVPEQAQVVRRIFDEYLSGNGPTSIARGLTRDGIPSSAAVDGRYEAFDGIDAWTSNAVSSILRNKVYIGVIEHFKTYSSRFDERRGQKRPDDEVIVVEYAHEPIIAKEVFSAAQKKRSDIAERMAAARASASAMRAAMPDAFAGCGVYCAHCGNRMAFNRGASGVGSTVGAYYRCYNRTRKEKCQHPVHVAEPLMRLAVGDALRRQLGLHATFEQLQEDIAEALEARGRLEAAEVQAKAATDAATHADAMRRLLYEDFISGRISEAEWVESKVAADALAADARMRKAQRDAAAERLRKDLSPNSQIKRVAERLGALTQVDRDVVDAFVERVEVVGPEDIRVVFKFEDYAERIKRLKERIR